MRDGATLDRPLRVAVIGGGPAGACAAETLAKGGIETTLIERKLDNCKVVPAARLSDTQYASIHRHQQASLDDSRIAISMPRNQLLIYVMCRSHVEAPSHCA